MSSTFGLGVLRTWFGAVVLGQVAGAGQRDRRESWEQAMRERCQRQKDSEVGLRNARIALDCGTVFASSGDAKVALSFYDLGRERLDPLLHEELIQKYAYQTALAERADGQLQIAAHHFKALLESLQEPERSNIDWWHEGLAALRDAGWHDAADRLFLAAQKAVPQAKWRHSWQVPRDIDERALDKAAPFHKPEDFIVSRLLQEKAAVIGAEFRSLQSSGKWDELFETNAHEAGGNVAAGSWRHLYLKRLNGTWDEANCKQLPSVCGLLQGRPEIDGQVFKAGVTSPSAATTPLASSQGVAVLELAPQSHLRLHTGRNNYRLLAHLGLQVPRGICGLHVGGERRLWEESSVLVLDDSFLHEAWNNSTDTARYVLYASFFPPSLRPSLPRVSARGDEL